MVIQIHICISISFIVTLRYVFIQFRTIFLFYLFMSSWSFICISTNNLFFLFAFVAYVIEHNFLFSSQKKTFQIVHTCYWMYTKRQHRNIKNSLECDVISLGIKNGNTFLGYKQFENYVCILSNTHLSLLIICSN